MMNYTQTVEYLFATTPSFQQVGADAYKPGLERIRNFCHQIGDPHKSYLTIHVAGTNGKGSVSHLLASILQSAGYRMGLFTSPHLHDFRERMRVDGEMISEQAVIDFVARYREDIQHAGLSFFEITTAMAFDFFATQDVEVAVVETGLGGRLDATNIITPILSVVTNIGLDHTDLLGNTLQAVAAEKAGIIKPGVAIVLGEADEQYNHIFEQRAAEQGSKLIYAQSQCEVESAVRERDMMRVRLRRKRDDKIFDLTMDLVGDYQRHNIVTAAAAADMLDRAAQLTIPCKAFVQGVGSVVKNTHLTGRWQKLADRPFTVCDTGHNAHGFKYIASELIRLQSEFERQICVIGFAREKSITPILKMLPSEAYYIFTQASSPRSLAAEELARQASEQGLQGEVQPMVSRAVERARELATERDMIFIGGSNFVVAEL